MKFLVFGIVIFYCYCGYGVIVFVNLMMGWIFVCFGSEVCIFDLNLLLDEVQYVDGIFILFCCVLLDCMLYVCLMVMVCELYCVGYQWFYFYSWFKLFGLYWCWYFFSGLCNWIEWFWCEGWYGLGVDYNFNLVMGWGDGFFLFFEELVCLLVQFDLQGLVQVLGEDEVYVSWFELVCVMFLLDYVFSFGWYSNGSILEYLLVILI